MFSLENVNVHVTVQNEARVQSGQNTFGTFIKSFHKWRRHIQIQQHLGHNIVLNCPKAYCVENNR